MPVPHPPPVEVADLVPPDAAGTSDAWVAGYLWLRAGRHDLAWAWWEEVPARDAARTEVSRAASLRERGQHGEAEVRDRRALGSASDPSVGAAASVSLVADAVGRADPDGSRRRLAEATAAVDPLSFDDAGDRQRIRLGWVTAEVALLVGEQVEVELPRVGPDGELVVPRVYRAGTRHHLAKGLMFAGVVHRSPRDLDRAAQLAPVGWRWAVDLARADLD